MSVIVLTLVIGVLNLWLGYAVAVRLGYGPPSLLDTWDVLTAEQGVRRTGVEHPAPIEAPTGQRIEEVMTAPLEEMLDQPDDDPYDDPYRDPYGGLPNEPESDHASEPLQPEYLEVWDLNEKFVETSVLKLNIAMIKSGAKATDLDSRLRAVRGRCDAQTIERCLVELIEDCEIYLAEQSEAAAHFGARLEELGGLRSLGEEIEAANLEQAAQIERTLSNLQLMEFESDLESANERLLDEIQNLCALRHKLRDDQDRAFLAIARYENRMDKIEQRLFNDPLTKLRNRIGLESTLWQWWQEGRHESRPMCAALFDLDRFGELNAAHGLLAGDRVLYELAQFIEKRIGESDLVVRFAGQRFLLMMVNVGPRAGTKNAEFIRQSIEKITFLDGDQEIRVTVRCGISEVTPEDTHEELFARLEQALEQAKQAGPNRSFYHNGREAELIESPNLGAKFTEIAI